MIWNAKYLQFRHPDEPELKNLTQSRAKAQRVFKSFNLSLTVSVSWSRSKFALSIGQAASGKSEKPALTGLTAYGGDFHVIRCNSCGG